MSKYPDISHYHPVSDWKKVKANCPFLISKATEGTTFVDNTLSAFIAGCETNGIPYWLYTFLKKGNEKAQAEFMVKTCKPLVGKFFVGYVLDVERDNEAANVKVAMDYLNGLGVKTMVYTGYKDYDRYKGILTGRPAHCAWWEARYGLNTGTYNASYPCHSGIDLHQFTSNGTCDGISGRCDLNRIVGKGESWYTIPLDRKIPTNTTTTNTVAAKIIAKAKGEVGVKEQPANSNKVKYNTDYYGREVSGGAYPWCCAFVWWLFKECGASEYFFGGEKTAHCATLLDYCKKNGTFSKTPKVGSIVFFQFDKDADPDHVGIVTGIQSDGKIVTVEGNTSTSNDANGGAVMERVRSASTIIGYAYPYDMAVKGGGVKVTVELPMLKSGNKGETVRVLQILLNGFGYNCGTVDGDFGAKTIAAVKKFQGANGLAQDGVVGTNTWKKLLL